VSGGSGAHDALAAGAVQSAQTSEAASTAPRERDELCRIMSEDWTYDSPALFPGDPTGTSYSRA